jgi:SAM-dependent methyltransferase
VTPQSGREQAHVSVGHYKSRGYLTKERVCSYWHQVDEILTLGASTVLEVGPGNGLVTDWLRQAGVQVTTLDVDPRLEPDITGSVTQIPLEADAYDAVLCCQVLEHLPFTEAERALHELARVARLGAVLSVPDATPWLGKAYPLFFPGWYLTELRERLPSSRRALLRDLIARRLRFRDWLFLRLVPAEWAFGGRTLEFSRAPIPRGSWKPEPGNAHHWEVGADGVPLDRLLETAREAGFRVERNYRVPENPWHRFLLLRLPGVQAIAC